ncbi:MAG: hypothetical protein P4L42_13735 [Desulfocapsaceae bacterium]|nr:hypothetical protein [Desulfocapsaceae bacterium]
MATQNGKEAAIDCIRQAAAKYPSTIICRDEVPSFTGGALSAGYLANLDSKGEGPANPFKFGRRQCYPVDSLVNWLISRLEV